MPGNTWAEWEDEELPFSSTYEDANQAHADEFSRGQTDVFDYGSDNQGRPRGTPSQYQIPTSTSNPDRPRSVAAKYDPTEGAIYVVMRSYFSRIHGDTWYTPVVKYWPMTAKDWSNFRRSYSKGRYIALNWDNKAFYEDVGDTTNFDQFLTTAVNYARSQQRLREGLAQGQSSQSDIYQKLRKAVREGRKVTEVKLRSDRSGGTGRKRSQEAQLKAAEEMFYRRKMPS